MTQPAPIYQRNQDATIYVGNLDQRVHQQLLWELFIQVGPVVNVHIPRDRSNNEHQGFGFIEFRGQQDADYSIKIMHMIKLYGKPIKVNKASQQKKNQDIGANIFIGNLDSEVDQKLLFTTFSSFGNILTVRINRDNMTGASHGYGFISFDNFQSSDSAIQSMNGQFLCNRPISVSYSFKRDSKNEKHGHVAERILAANRPYTRSTWGGFESQTVTLEPVLPANIPPPPPRNF